MAVCVSCSRNVRHTRRELCAACYKHWRKWNNPPNVTCEWCGRRYFEPAPKKHTLCSLECFSAWKIGRNSRNESIAGRRRPPVDRNGRVALACEHCGSPFRVRPYELKRLPKYCSPACNAARRIVLRALVPCEHCGALFCILPNRFLLVAGRFCSRKCYEATRKANKMPREAPRSRAYKRFRNVLVSQSGQCCRCGAQENLVVHHRVRTRERPDLLFARDNLEVLCSSCHTKAHARVGLFRIPEPAESQE
jgi:5-methylcytosine-specific restriction endonuclease McrA